MSAKTERLRIDEVKVKVNKVDAPAEGHPTATSSCMENQDNQMFCGDAGPAAAFCHDICIRKVLLPLRDKTGFKIGERKDK